MGSAKAPKAPDYSGLAIQQSQLDRQTAQDITNMNRINQIDPYGQTTFTQTLSPEAQTQKAQIQSELDAYDQAVKAHPNWAPDLIARDRGAIQARLSAITNAPGATTQVTTLNPQQQALLNQQVGLQGQQNTRIGELLSSFQTPTLGATTPLKEANQNDIQNLLYGQITKQYGDRFAREEAAQRANLANQGFQMGSEGYQNTLGDFNKEKNSAYQDAATQAALASYGQMNTERGQNLNEFQAQNQNELGRYNTQMGYLSQLLGGVNGPQTPQYQPYAQAAPYQSPDMLGAAQQQYQAKVGNANAGNAAKGQTMSTVGALGTAAAVAF